MAEPSLPAPSNSRRLRKQASAQSIDDKPSDHAGHSTEGDNAMNMMTTIQARASGAAIAISLEASSLDTSELDTALADIAATPERGTHAFCDDERGLFDHLPDLRAGRSLDDALRHLTHIAQVDPASYPNEWHEEVRDVGGSAYANYPKQGARHLYVGQPCDKQENERRRRVDALCEHMRSIDGMKDQVGDFLELHGHCTDNRARDMRETTSAVRDFIAVGFRIFLHPDGKLGSSGSMPHKWFRAGPERSAEIEDAARRYDRVRRRWRNEAQIKRAIRMLGTVESNGFIVLSRKEI